MGCDFTAGGGSVTQIGFQSTHPAWDVTWLLVAGLMHHQFQSTHPAWDVTTLATFADYICTISIHTSRMGCDLDLAFRVKKYVDFNPHIPHGMWLRLVISVHKMYLFQSTHPAWDVTCRFVILHWFQLISIHTSRMGCDSSGKTVFEPIEISIHTSRMGCDEEVMKKFQKAGISIHTSRMGCDRNGNGIWVRCMGFQSTHPAWDVTMSDGWYIGGFLFQSTHPAWDVTKILCIQTHGFKISIHTSRMGCDFCTNHRTRVFYLFQSTHPAWDVTDIWKRKWYDNHISIHTSRMGCDNMVTYNTICLCDFNPHIPHGMWPLLKLNRFREINFNPHIPHGMWHSGEHTH